MAEPAASAPMRVTELDSAGLRRVFAVTLPAAEIAARRERRVAAIRRGHQAAGLAVSGEAAGWRHGAAIAAAEEAIGQAVRRLLAGRGLRPALPPRIGIASGRVTEGADLTFHVEVELLPAAILPDLAGLRLERLRAEPGEAELAAVLAALAARHATEEPVAEARPAARGDLVVCDIEGRLAPNLLRNPGAQGPLGRMPRHWHVMAPATLTHAVAGRGPEGGIPCLDIRLGGAARRGDQFILFPEEPAAIPAADGDVFALSLHWRLLHGALPPGAVAALFVNERSDTDFLRHNRITVPPPEVARPLAARRLGGAVALAGGAVVRHARPGLLIEFRQPAEIDVVLRIGLPRLVRGGEDAAAAEAPPGEPVPGGSAEGLAVEAGGEGFLPGFADGLEGIRTGETRRVSAVFPLDHPAAALAGREAWFTVTARALRRRVPPPLDDAFARRLGFADRAALEADLRRRLREDYEALAERRLRRALRDRLAERAGFPVPEGLVAVELASLRRRVEAGPRLGRIAPEHRGLDEPALRDACRAAAERRVRLGLLIPAIARAEGIVLSAADRERAARAASVRHPGQEREALAFFHRHPDAVEAFCAPLLEERVLDHLLREHVAVTERQVTPMELVTHADEDASSEHQDLDLNAQRV